MEHRPDLLQQGLTQHAGMRELSMVQLCREYVCVVDTSNQSITRLVQGNDKVAHVSAQTSLEAETIPLITLIVAGRESEVTRKGKGN